MSMDNFPRKDEYKFKEVTSITGVKPYVLRFWESEFVHINPQTLESGQKVYSHKDVEYINRIKNLLFTDKLSIPKAKALLDEELLLATKAHEEQEDQKPVMEFDQMPVDNSSDFGVEVRDAIGSIIGQHSDHLDEYKEALKKDLEEQKQIIVQKQFNDQDVLRLVQTKKKLTNVLTKIDTIIEKNNWA